MVGGGVTPLSKSRYSSVSRYIGRAHGPEEAERLRALNDLEPNEDACVRARASSAGLDETLAAHLAHLFARDPLVIFNDTVHIDDEARTDHFETIQSTNWRTVRWKLPVMRAADVLQSRLQAGMSPLQANALSYSDPGWRVEFRPLEVQLTDFENAAWAIMYVCRELFRVESLCCFCSQQLMCVCCVLL
jgi:glutamate--cysteine ligase catalytic subunit